MIHAFYIYFIINSFLLGEYVCGSDYKIGKVWVVRFYCFLLAFFGAFVLLFDRTFPRIFKWFDYIDNEIRFQYRFYFTDYFDTIYLDGKYTEFFDTLEKKLKRTNDLAQKSGCQVKRHNRSIQKRYGSKKENS